MTDPQGTQGLVGIIGMSFLCGLIVGGWFYHIEAGRRQDRDNQQRPDVVAEAQRKGKVNGNGECKETLPPQP